MPRPCLIRCHRSQVCQRHDADRSNTTTLDVARRVNPGRVVGFDYVAHRIDKANELVAEQQCRNVSFSAGDANDLPFEDDTFDVVYSHTVLGRGDSRPCNEGSRGVVSESGGVPLLRDGLCGRTEIVPRKNEAPSPWLIALDVIQREERTAHALPGEDLEIRAAEPWCVE